MDHRARARDQREAVHDLAFRRYPLNQWTADDAHWLPHGAWAKCAASYTIELGEKVWVAADIGGERSDSALVWATSDLRIGCAIYHGDEGILRVGEKVRELAETYEVVEFIHDPWRSVELALHLAEERMNVVTVPQTASRAVPMAETLYKTVVEGRLRHPNHPTLNAHVAAAVARVSPRGWRLERPDRNTCIDGCIALAMAVERAQARVGEAALLGWV